jgi:hypothetical protein
LEKVDPAATLFPVLVNLVVAHLLEHSLFNFKTGLLQFFQVPLVAGQAARAAVVVQLY